MTRLSPPPWPLIWKVAASPLAGAALLPMIT
jgi:hypothetical protein